MLLLKPNLGLCAITSSHKVYHLEVMARRGMIRPGFLTDMAMHPTNPSEGYSVVLNSTESAIEDHPRRCASRRAPLEHPWARSGQACFVLHIPQDKSRRENRLRCDIFMKCAATLPDRHHPCRICTRLNALATAIRSVQWRLRSISGWKRSTVMHSVKRAMALHIELF